MYFGVLAITADLTTTVVHSYKSLRNTHSIICTSYSKSVKYNQLWLILYTSVKSMQVVPFILKLYTTSLKISLSITTGVFMIDIS